MLTQKWMQRAACTEEEDKDVFFPRGKDDPKYQVALAYCRICPVTKECIKYAVDTRTDSGIWGGIYIAAPRRST